MNGSNFCRGPIKMFITVRIEVTPACIGFMDKIIAKGAAALIDKDNPERLAIAEEQLYNIVRRINSELYGEKS